MQISLRICAAKDPACIHADNEYSDQTARMRRLIWVFGGRTYKFVGKAVLYRSFWVHVKEEEVYNTFHDSLSYSLISITKTRLFKYIEIFNTK